VRGKGTSKSGPGESVPFLQKGYTPPALSHMRLGTGIYHIHHPAADLTPGSRTEARLEIIAPGYIVVSLDSDHSGVQDRSLAAHGYWDSHVVVVPTGDDAQNKTIEQVASIHIKKMLQDEATRGHFEIIPSRS
jgi:hypothetical protein